VKTVPLLIYSFWVSGGDGLKVDGAMGPNVKGKGVMYGKGPNFGMGRKAIHQILNSFRECEMRNVLTFQSTLGKNQYMVRIFQ
jgi:hypothetical protein